MFKDYRALHDGIPSIGETLFHEVVTMMTKKGEYKTGLSTYYVWIKHCQDVFICSSVKRLSLMPCIRGLPHIFQHKSPTQAPGVWTVVDDMELVLAKQVVNLCDFLTYSYSTNHLTSKDGMKCHCCKFALNKETICLHPHPSQQQQECKQCYGPMMSFYGKLPSYTRETYHPRA
jgi:hypothetical protein